MSTIKSKTAKSVALNSLENKLMRFKGGISACNFFYSENKDAAIAYINERFQEIVNVNPWLKGSCSSGKKRQVYLNYDTNETNADPLIYSGQAPNNRTESSKYSEILEVCEPYIVEKAFTLFKKKDRLTKLTILHINDHRFLVMYSLSHLIADGFTFYQIFNMLSSEHRVYSLDVTRRNEVAQIKDIIPKKNARFLFNPRMIFWAIGRAFSWKKMRIKSFDLNLAYVQEQKEKAMANGKVPFVSTNDVLSSCYAGLCESNALIMAVNFRDRIPAITSNDAGNYEELLVIDQNTSSSNESIRVLVNDLQAHVPRITLPQGSAMSKSNPVLITNWAGFSRPIFIKHAQEPVHMPLYTSREITFDSCIVYCPQAGKVSALLFMKDLHENKVRAHPLFDEN
jgi:hypothetical protein